MYAHSCCTLPLEKETLERFMKALELESNPLMRVCVCERERDRQTDRQRERQRQRQRETERDRETERETERERKKEKEGHRNYNTI